MKYKVFIPSAGLGSRLGNYCENKNKSLISIGNKPSISYIIEKIPTDIEIVIAIGYKGELLKDLLEVIPTSLSNSHIDLIQRTKELIKKIEGNL